ncbi:MAG: hypothetical protein ACC655_07570, partial [Rhodothermia bacterium]
MKSTTRNLGRCLVPVLLLSVLPTPAAAQTYSAQDIQRLLDDPAASAAQTAGKHIRGYSVYSLFSGLVRKGARTAVLDCPSTLGSNDLFTFEASISHQGDNPSRDVFLEATTVGGLVIEALRADRGSVTQITPDTARVEIGTLSNETVGFEVDLRASGAVGPATLQIRLGLAGSSDFIDSCEITIFAAIEVEGDIMVDGGATLTIQEFVELRLVGDAVRLILIDGAEIDGDGVVAFTE